MLTIEAFTRWEAGGPSWRGFMMSTCPRCLKPHRVEDEKVLDPCRELQTEPYQLIVSDHAMSEVRRPLRGDDDPSDFTTPWLRIKPEHDHPDF